MKLYYEPDLDEIFEIEGVKYKCVNQSTEFSTCNRCCFGNRHPLCHRIICTMDKRFDDTSVIIIKI